MPPVQGRVYMQSYIHNKTSLTDASALPCMNLKGRLPAHWAHLVPWEHPAINRLWPQLDLATYFNSRDHLE